VLFPPAVYLVMFTILGMRGSPRLFALLIFPTVLGLALFVYDEFRRHEAARRCLAALVVLVFAADSVPEFIRFYSLSNPPLRELGERLRHQSVMLVGDQSDLNVYYFPEARSVAGGANREETLAAVQAAKPAPKYILMGIDCRRMLTNDAGSQVGVPDIQGLGYSPVERLIDWTYEEQAGDNERQPCFVLFTPPSATTEPPAFPIGRVARSVDWRRRDTDTCSTRPAAKSPVWPLNIRRRMELRLCSRAFRPRHRWET
jgi:hypothetical protein